MSNVPDGMSQFFRRVGQYLRRGSEVAGSWIDEQAAINQRVRAIRRLRAQQQTSLTTIGAKVYATAGGSRLAMLASRGRLELSHNWLNSGWRNSHDDFQGSIQDLGGNVTGDSPGFVDAGGQDFHLADGSHAVNAGTALPAGTGEHPVDLEYVEHQSHRPRPRVGQIDIGAFERCTGPDCQVEDIESIDESPTEADAQDAVDLAPDAESDDAVQEADAYEHPSDIVDNGGQDSNESRPSEEAGEITDTVADASDAPDSDHDLHVKDSTDRASDTSKGGTVDGSCGCGAAGGGFTGIVHMLALIATLYLARRGDMS